MIAAFEQRRSVGGRRKKRQKSYEVEAFVERRCASGAEEEVLVKWKGYGDDEMTWEPMAAMKKIKGVLMPRA